MSATTQLILIVCFFFFVLTSKFSPHCHPCRSSLIGKDGLRFFSSLLQIFALAFSFSPLALPLPHLALLLLLPIFQELRWQQPIQPLARWSWYSPSCARSSWPSSPSPLPPSSYPPGSRVSSQSCRRPPPSPPPTN